MAATMQLNKSISNEEFMDCILREAADGYGDLVAAARIHQVSLKSLQARLMEWERAEYTWIS
jgi:hypothetical protein